MKHFYQILQNRYSESCFSAVAKRDSFTPYVDISLFMSQFIWQIWQKHIIIRKIFSFQKKERKPMQYSIRAVNVSGDLLTLFVSKYCKIFLGHIHLKLDLHVKSGW